jgi:predicted DNA-binding helix-hairpin-helix protein
MPGGQLDLDVDPKTQWALANRAMFPVDVNRAPRELLLRIPGIGVRCVDRILRTRGQRRLRYADLLRMGCNLRRARHFIEAADHHPPHADLASSSLRALLARPTAPEQASLW